MNFASGEMAHCTRSKISFTAAEPNCQVSKSPTSSSSARVLPSGSPLTRDMIQMSMTSVVTDTSRMKSEIAPALIYPNFRNGLGIVRQADFS